MLAKKIQHEKAAVGLIEQARREWVEAEQQEQEFHAKNLQPLVDEEMRLRQQLALAEGAVKEASSLEEIAAARERAGEIAGRLEELRRKMGDVNQVLEKMRERALSAKRQYELLLGRKAWLENAVRHQEGVVLNRKALVEETERDLVARRQALEEAQQVLESLRRELAAM